MGRPLLETCTYSLCWHWGLLSFSLSVGWCSISVTLSIAQSCWFLDYLRTNLLWILGKLSFFFFKLKNMADYVTVSNHSTLFTPARNDILQGKFIEKWNDRYTFPVAENLSDIWTCSRAQLLWLLNDNMLTVTMLKLLMFSRCNIYQVPFLFRMLACNIC